MPQAVIGAIIVGASSFAAGTTILGLSALATAAVLTGATLGLKLLQSTVNSRPDMETVVRNQARPGAPMFVPYGTTKMGMQVADIRDDPTNEIDLHTVRALCVGSEDAASGVGQTNGGDIGGVRKVWFDEEIALDAVDNGWDGSGFNGGLTNNHLPEQNLGESIDGIIDDPWLGAAFERSVTVDEEGELAIRFDYALKLGGIDQGTDTGDPGGRVSGINGVWPEAWPTTSQGDGLAWFNFLLRQEPDPVDRSVFRGGIPNFTAEVDGRRVYDPRDSTWKHSGNPALCILDYLTSDMVGFGANYPERDGPIESPTQIDEGSFIAAANHCDERVAVPDDAGGTTTQKRYTCDVALDTTASLKQNLAILESSCMGHVIWQEGTYRLWIRQAQAPEDFVLDEDNIIGDWNFKRLGSGDVANSLTVRFPDKDRSYTTQEITWPRPGGPNPYMEVDNGVKEQTELPLHATTDAHRAERIAATLLKEERADLRVALTATEAALQLQVGDLVPITHDLPGWTEKLFWVESMTIGENFQVQLALREYDADAFAREVQDDRDDVPDDDTPDEVCTGAEEPDWDGDLEAFFPLTAKSHRTDIGGTCAGGLSVLSDACRSRLSLSWPFGPFRHDVSGNGHTAFIEKQTGAASYVIQGATCLESEDANCIRCCGCDIWLRGRCFVDTVETACGVIAIGNSGVPDFHAGKNPLAITSGEFFDNMGNGAGAGFTFSGSFMFNAVQGEHALCGGDGWKVAVKQLDDPSGAEMDITGGGTTRTLDIDPITEVADFLINSAQDATQAANNSDADWYDIGVTYHAYIPELDIAPVTVVMNGTFQGVVFVDTFTGGTTNIGIGQTAGGTFNQSIRGAYSHIFAFNAPQDRCKIRWLHNNLCAASGEADTRSGSDDVITLAGMNEDLDTCSGGSGLTLSFTPDIVKANLPEGAYAMLEWYEYDADGVERTLVNRDTDQSILSGSSVRTWTYTKTGVGSDAASTDTHWWQVNMYIFDRDGQQVDWFGTRFEFGPYGTC